MYDYFMGIDPGLKGAWVIMDKAGEIQAYYKFETLTVKDTKKKLDMNAFFNRLHMQMQVFPKTLIILEEIHASAGQHPSSIFSMGHSLGAIQMALAGCKLPHLGVSPQKWKNALLSGYKKEKDASVVKALEIYPEASDILIGPKGGRDDNMADALLIAEWGRRQYVAT